MYPKYPRFLLARLSNDLHPLTLYLCLGSSQADDTAILRQYPATQARVTLAPQPCFMHTECEFSIIQPYSPDQFGLRTLQASTANFSSWTSKTVCNGSFTAWDGVRCINGRVTQLHLSSAGLVGTLPAAWSNLTSLWSLDVRYSPLKVARCAHGSVEVQDRFDGGAVQQSRYASANERSTKSMAVAMLPGAVLHLMRCRPKRSTFAHFCTEGANCIF